MNRSFYIVKQNWMNEISTGGTIASVAWW